jgi:hypothetical protein
MPMLRPKTPPSSRRNRIIGPLSPRIGAFPEFQDGFDVVLGGFGQHFYFLLSAFCFRWVVALGWLQCSLGVASG